MKLDSLYELRKSFSIIGVTGRTGSGCTKFSELLEADFDSIETSFIRNPSEMNNAKYNRDFKRVFQIAHRFCSSQGNWKKYKRIEYKNVLYTLMLVEWVGNNKLFEHLLDKYYKQVYGIESIDTTKLKEDIALTLRKSAYTSVLETMQGLNEYLFGSSSDKEQHLELVGKFFRDSNTTKLLNEINGLLAQNYLARTYLLHHIACNYRKYSSAVEGDSNGDIYFIIRFINQMIKTHREPTINQKQECHIVIDSLRNSMEIMFLKERYSAFYMVAIKGQNRYDRLKRRFETNNKTGPKDETERKLIVDKLLELDETEYKCGDFKKGDLASPDVQNCIGQSDIHLFNSGLTQRLNQQGVATIENQIVGLGLEDNLNTFLTLAEQSMKLQSLIQQPGIVTPSPLERCMQAAYSAKLNSGCISRQVGAVVTDDRYAIKAIGWNDVPSHSTPCKLRDINDLLSDQNSELYTDFELGKGQDEYELIDSKTDRDLLRQEESKEFNSYLKKAYSKIDENFKKSGKPCSFCFKTAYNKFSGEDNQVHTRSLHAEENAMLQISKHGGQPLKGGYLFTTASTCELCAKKAYQLGVKKIFYIDPYPGISMSHILKNKDDKDPELVFFQGAVGRAFHKLYEPFMAYKDELTIETGVRLDEPIKVQKSELKSLLKQHGGLSKEQEQFIKDMSESEFKDILTELKSRLEKK